MGSRWVTAKGSCTGDQVTFVRHVFGVPFIALGALSAVGVLRVVRAVVTADEAGGKVVGILECLWVCSLYIAMQRVGLQGI